MFVACVACANRQLAAEMDVNGAHKQAATQ